MEEFQIVLDHPNFLFVPNTISGHVYIRCNGSVNARKVCINIHGNGKTSWKIIENDNGRSTYVPYYRDFVVINQQYIIWQQSDSGYLSSGEHRLPFAFKIESVLPPWLESKHAYIRYGLTAVVDRPGKSDKTAHIDLNLSPYYDLRYNQIASNPFENRVVGKVGSMFKKGEVEVKISITKTGFSMGEELVFMLDIKNHSDRDIYKLEIMLIQEVFCSADRHHIMPMFDWKISWGRHAEVEYKRDQWALTSVEKKIHVSKGREDSGKHAIMVPQTTPSFCGLCESIELKHYLKVIVYASGTFTDDKVECSVPVIIGHAPL